MKPAVSRPTRARRWAVLAKPQRRRSNGARLHARRLLEIRGVRPSERRDGGGPAVSPGAAPRLSSEPRTVCFGQTDASAFLRLKSLRRGSSIIPQRTCQSEALPGGVLRGCRVCSALRGHSPYLRYRYLQKPPPNPQPSRPPTPSPSLRSTFRSDESGEPSARVVYYASSFANWRP